jgi:hypothetical protein
MRNFVEKLVEKRIDSHKKKIEAQNNKNLTPEEKKARIEEHSVGDQLAKLNLNIMTGLFGKNVSKYRDVRFIADTDLRRYINSPLLEREELIEAEGTTDLIKIIKKKKTAVDNIPTHISAFSMFIHLKSD